MEKDIKILEYLINRWKYNKAGLERETQAIENIIKRYKELEQENRYKIIGRIDAIRIEDLEDILSPYYIPKSKIKEKIKELDKIEKQELKGLKGQDRYFIKQIYMYKRNTLQELLDCEVR